MASDYFNMESSNNIDTNNTSENASTSEEPVGGASSRVKKVLRKSGTVVQEPSSDDTRYATDDEYSFLASGRDFEPMNTTHKYTDQEKKTLATYESLDYLPSHSDIYKSWVRRQKVSSYQLDVWLMMGLIGFCIGVIGFVLHQLIEKIADVKWEITQKYIEEKEFATACAFATGYSVLFILFSAGIVVYLRPCAGGSGIPEITGFLNGVNVRHIFNIKTMVVKFLSCVTCVGCGLPVGPEGPMIHLGALVGAGLSQFKSETLGLKLPIMEKFRTSEARRNFISAGAAAGVASAFGAPVGGLLFSMEEVSSFWTVTLSWQIFFCCIMSTFTTDLFNSAFMDFEYTGQFGQFKTNRYILFEIDQGVDVNIVMFLPTMLIGVIGGLLGAAFTIMNLKITRFRKNILHKIDKEWKQKLVKLFEPVLIMILVTIFSILIPMAFECTKFECIDGATGKQVDNCFNNSRNVLHTDEFVVRYTCDKGTEWKQGNYSMTNGTYNEVASLLFGTLEDAVTFLFSRDTHLEFNFASLFSVLPFYLIAVSWACSTAVSCGALVPMLMVGAIYGRIVGRIMVLMFGVHQDGYWDWMDPGAFALIGAASFFGGVTRLTLATTVIMMELTNDVQVLLPVMAAVMVAKWVGDFFTHPIYHALLELKCIPFLDPEPRVMVDKKQLELELFRASDVMSSPVVTIHQQEMVKTLAKLLLDTTHGGYPVIKKGDNEEEHFYGLITRLDLAVILMNEELFVTVSDVESYDTLQETELPHWIEFEQLNIHKLKNPEQLSEILHRYIEDPKYKHLTIDLKPYINQSAMAIAEKFSLKRTYVLFRTLGLRHLTIIDSKNIVTGIITRKDLMGFMLQERLSSKLSAAHRQRNGRVEMQSIAEPV